MLKFTRFSNGVLSQLLGTTFLCSVFCDTLIRGDSSVAISCQDPFTCVSQQLHIVLHAQAWSSWDLK